MTAALTLVAALSVPFASAQTTQPADQAASQQDPEQAKAEFEAYSAWYAAYKANDFAKTIELGEPFVQKFPNSKYTKFIRDFIPRARVQLFNQAQQQGNINEMIRRGREIIAADPSKEIDIVTALAVAIRQKELVANPPNFSHAAEATEFTKRTAELIEAGKIPTGADPKKFNETKGQTLGFLYQTLAMIEDKNRNNQDKALEYYVKAAQFEPNNPAYYFECGRIHQLKYAAATDKYNAFPEEKRKVAPESMEPDVKAAFDLINTEADAVINCWARFLGLAASSNSQAFPPAMRAEVTNALKELYKFRHPDEPDGYQKLIDQHRANSTPPGASGTGNTASSNQ
jgi:hypothetical protein